MEINSYIRGKNIIAELKGNLDLNNSKTVQNMLLDLCKQIKGKTLVINMQEVPYIDSSGISVLMLTYKEVYDAGGELCLWNVVDHVHEILKLTHVDKIFKICSDQEIK